MTASATLVEPAYHSAPDYDFTLGPVVGEFCSSVGYKPDPEQQPIIDDTFAEDEHQLPVTFATTVVGPRRNIKTGVEIQIALGWLFVLEVHNVDYSAHKWKTALETFTTMHQIIRNSDDLSRRMLKPLQGTGYCRLRLKPSPATIVSSSSPNSSPGAEMRFATRTLAGGRGEESDKQIYDEALMLRRQHISSLLLGMATRPLAQIVYGSSACLATSEVLRELVERGRAGAIDPTKRDRRMSYTEYCAPGPEVICDLGKKCTHRVGTPGCGFDKPEWIAIANPQYGRRISPQFFIDSRVQFAAAPADYGREVMGWHDVPVKTGKPPAIDTAKFAKLEDPESTAATVTAFGVDMDPDRRATSIGVAGPRADGLTHVEHIVKIDRSDRVVAQCRRFNRRNGPAVFVVDGDGQAATFVDELREPYVWRGKKFPGLKVEVLSSGQVAEACAGWQDATAAGTYRWRSHPELEAAAGNARRWLRGKRFVFAAEDQTQEITALYGCVLARYLRDELNYDVEDSIL